MVCGIQFVTTINHAQGVRQLLKKLFLKTSYPGHPQVKIFELEEAERGGQAVQPDESTDPQVIYIT